MKGNGDPAQRIDTRAAVILLSASVLPTVYRCFGSPGFFQRHWASLFGGSAFTPMYAVLYAWLSVFVLFFLVPALIAGLVLKVRLRDLGLRVGDWRKGLVLLGLLFPIAALTLVPTARMADFRAEYPLYHAAGQSLRVFVVYELCYAVYYLGWEFFFRGFLLFGLAGTFGAVNAVLIQTIPSTLAHIGKPTPEIFAAILAGVVFGAIALRTRSILYVIVLHWLIGVTLDVLIVFGPAWNS
jgi:membrane protease YdiL (CAAX protease family)